MDFVSYPHLILLISGQTFEVTVAHENFWELNGPLIIWCTYGARLPDLINIVVHLNQTARLSTTKARSTQELKVIFFNN